MAGATLSLSTPARDSNNPPRKMEINANHRDVVINDGVLTNDSENLC